MEKKKIEIPIRVRICSEIKEYLIKAKEKGYEGIVIEKLVSEYIMKEGWTRRFILECITAVGNSNFAKIKFNEKKEKIIIKK